jgi:hypothetical protein
VARVPHDIVDLVSRVYGRPPRIVATSSIQLLHLEDYPLAGRTTIVTNGLAVIGGPPFRRRVIAQELITTIVGSTDIVEQRLVAAIDDECAAHRRGDGYLRVISTTHRGIMYNGVFEAASAPHLLFATDLSQTPALAKRTRVGDGYIEFLPAVPITQRELSVYDRSPPGLIAYLRNLGISDVSQRA